MTGRKRATRLRKTEHPVLKSPGKDVRRIARKMQSGTVSIRPSSVFGFMPGRITVKDGQLSSEDVIKARARQRDLQQVGKRGLRRVATKRAIKRAKRNKMGKKKS